MPATNGSRMSRSSHSSSANAATASAQNSICRVGIIAAVPPRPCPGASSRLRGADAAVGAHMAHPFADIGGERKQRQGGNGAYGHVEHDSGVETEPERGQHQT